MLAVCALLALPACEHQPMPGVNPTPASAPIAPPPPTTVDVTDTTVTTTTSIAPSGQEVIEVDETETEVEVEVEPAAYSAAREAAISDCYAFAWSQVQHDVLVQEDRAGIVDSTVNPGFTVFTQELDAYGNEKRRGELFDKCMEAKGYVDDY